jgi:hypothetical protein
MINRKKLFRICLHYLLSLLLLFFLSGAAYAVIPDPEPDGACPSWAYLNSLGGQAKSEPVIQSYNGRLIVIVQGMNDGIWVKEWNRTVLTGWYMIPDGSTYSRPKLALDNALFMYVNGTDGFVYKTRYLGPGNWSPWVNMNISGEEFGNSGPNVSAGYKAYSVGPNKAVKIGECVNSSPPDWTNDLIIYEVATKEYTSPYGPETGNFRSLKEKIPYMAELGITGVWLTGHSWSDPHHFFNIWTQYACIRPEVLDPSLGTEQDFKDLIDEAHKYDIRIFLDAITHGVMDNSSLVSDHPDWFYESSWRMTDYDWSNKNGDQKALEDWWVDTWTRYVTAYGVDGFRLDLGHSRHDLWARIRKNAQDAGHPILLISEAYDQEALESRVYDLWEHDRGVQIDSGGIILLEPTHTVQVTYSDGTSSNLAHITTKPPNSTQAGVISALYLGIDSDRVGQAASAKDGILDHHVRLSGLDSSKTIANIDVKTGNGEWQTSPPAGIWYAAYIRTGNEAELYFSPFAGESSMEDSDRKYYAYHLSCHDFGGYALQQSRYKFGYGLMFLPVIPLFMSGEEFNNNYTPVPNKIMCLYPNDTYWCADWLYSSQMQWQQLNETTSRNLFEDIKKIISLRKNETALSYFAPALKDSNLMSLTSYRGGIPMPYVRWTGNTSVLIIGNPDITSGRNVTVDIPLENMSLAGYLDYSITDLWTMDRSDISEEKLHNYSTTVSPDNFRIFRIEPRTDSSTTTTTTTSSTTTTTTITSTTTTLPFPCALKGDYLPCDEVSLQEIIDAINAWAADEFALTDVINLINAWAYG